MEVHETALLGRDELVSLLKTVNDINKARGGCQFVCKVTSNVKDIADDDLQWNLSNANFLYYELRTG